MILVVALVAAAAAATGPIYYAASKSSILRDDLTTVPATARGLEVVSFGGVSTSIGPLAAETDADLATSLGGASTLRRVFSAPIEALETNAYFTSLKEQIPLVWRTDVCAHLGITGTCPTGVGQVVISRSLAVSNSWHVGQRLTVPVWGTLTVTGLYTPPATSTDYFYDRDSMYFPYEFPPRGPMAPAV